jgi:undecaprenyl-diphosphatase
MARRRALALIVIGAVSTLASGAIIVAVVTTFDSVVGDPDPWTLMRVYLVARVATSFVPTPGALAALDAALIAGLLGAGVDPQIATAAVLIYRATTFVLPILLGGATYLGWRRWSGRQDVDSQVATPVAA